MVDNSPGLGLFPAVLNGVWWGLGGDRSDFQGALIPARASDGSVLWIRLDPVPVMGRLVVLRQKSGVASNYDCLTCPCCAEYTGLRIDPSTVTLVPGETQQLTAMAEFLDCNMNPSYLNVTGSSSWSSDKTSVATVSNSNPKGRVTGIGPGTADIKATHSHQSCNHTLPCDPQSIPGEAHRTVKVQRPGFVKVVSNSCGSLQCNIGGIVFSTPLRALRYQVLDQARSSLKLAGMVISEYNSNYTEQGCNSLPPDNGWWLTDVNGWMVGQDGIATCSLTCYQGGSCTASWNQRFEVSHGPSFPVSVINGVLEGSKNLNSTSCGTCPVVTPVP
jgi:hypothetical protein